MSDDVGYRIRLGAKFVCVKLAIDIVTCKLEFLLFDFRILLLLELKSMYLVKLRKTVPTANNFDCRSSRNFL